MQGFTGIVIPSPFYMDISTEYTVTFNGTDYKCKVGFTEKTDLDSDGVEENIYWLGNLAAIGKESNGLPFIIASMQGDNAFNMGIYGFIAPLDGSTSGSFAVRYNKTSSDTAIILHSPGGKRFSLTVDDSGKLTTNEITE
jgi:hypothetical protein